MPPITRPQRLAIRRTYLRSADGARDYRTFRRRVLAGYGCLMLPWCGMWIGIEPDGYTHT
jgi:hypothetical protein